jgi:hypothetical protein
MLRSSGQRVMIIFHLGRARGPFSPLTYFPRAMEQLDWSAADCVSLGRPPAFGFGK